MNNLAVNTKTQKYNKSLVMRRAWQMFRANEFNTFGESLRESWNIEKNNIKGTDIETIYNKYYQQIFNFVLFRVNRNSDIANEITNDTFLKFNSRIQYDVYRGKITTLLYQIAKNASIDYHRTAHADRFTNIDSYTDESGKETFQIADESYTETVESNETSTQILNALNELKPKYKTVCELLFIQQKKYDEIAVIMGVSMSNVKVMVNRARKMLQTKLVNVRQLA